MDSIGVAEALNSFGPRGNDPDTSPVAITIDGWRETL